MEISVISSKIQDLQHWGPIICSTKSLTSIGQRFFQKQKKFALSTFLLILEIFHPYFKTYQRPSVESILDDHEMQVQGLRGGAFKNCHQNDRQKEREKKKVLKYKFYLLHQIIIDRHAHVPIESRYRKLFVKKLCLSNKTF